MFAFHSLITTNWAIEYLLVVTAAVTLVSLAAWLLALRLNRSAALRHFILLLALGACLASPVAVICCQAASFRLIQIPVLGTNTWQIQSTPDPKQLRNISTAQPISQPTEAVPNPSPPAIIPAVTTDPATLPQPILEPAPLPAIPKTRQVANSASDLNWRDMAAAAIFLWSVGSVLGLARLAYHAGQVILLRRASRPLASEDSQKLLAESTPNLALTQRPLLLVSPRKIAPLAVGFGRPAVILPELLLETLSNQELSAVVAHEVAHLERNDQWTVLLQGLASALFWPILSIHLLNRELQRAREEVCDNFVIASRDAIGYGETLLHIAELLVGAPPTTVAAVGILGRAGELERRIAGLFDSRRSKATSIGRKAAWGLVLLFSIGGIVASATRFAVSAPPENESNTPSATAATIDPADPDNTRRFYGQVVGPDGQPVADAEIYIAPFYEDRKLGPLRAKTDA